MSKTTFYTDDGKKILAGSGITLYQCDEMWRRIHGEGHRIIGMVAKADPIDLNAINFGPTDLTDYSGVEHVELNLDMPSGLCTINDNGSCSVEFKE